MFRCACVLVFLLISVSWAHESSAEHKAECKAYSGLNDSSVVLNLETMSQDRQVSCYVMCLGYYNRKINREGQVIVRKPHPETTYQLGQHSLISALVTEGLKKCANETGFDFCDTAHKTAICLNQNPMFTQYEEGTDVTSIYNAVVKTLKKFQKRVKASAKTQRAFNVTSKPTYSRQRPLRPLANLMEDEI